MRILLLNDTLFRSALEARGHEVMACGPAIRYLMPDQDRFEFTFPPHTMHDLDGILERLGGFCPDLIVHSETYSPYFYRGIERAPCLTVWRTIDNHLHAWQPQYSVTHDLVMVAQKDYLQSFREHHPDAYWLPLSCFPSYHFDRCLPRDIPVSFVGSLDPKMHLERTRFFEALRARVPVEVVAGLNQTQISEVYNRSRIVINQCVHRDLNYRVFEALANGALLLTPAIENGQSELFREGVELITYPPGNVELAAQRLRYYLEHEDERAAIARAGQQRVLREHTLDARVDTLLSLVGRCGEAAWCGRVQRLGAEQMRPLALIYAALHSRGFMSAQLAVESLERLAGEYPEEARQTAFRLGQELLERGDAHRAAPYLELAARQGHPVAEASLGRIRLMQGRLEEALALLERANAQEETPGLLYWKALCLDGLERRREACAVLERSLALAPGQGDTQRLLHNWRRALEAELD